MYTEGRTDAEVQNTGEGFLAIHVVTARGAIPLEGARVSVRSFDEALGVPRGDVIASVISGRDGNTPILPLSAPPRTASQEPSNGGPPPFASYFAEVRLEGYFHQSYANLAIFDGITSIQTVDMIPLPENGKTDSFTPDGERFWESENPEL